MSGHRRRGLDADRAQYSYPELRRYVLDAEEGRRNMSAAARAMGISPAALCAAVKRAGLRRRSSEEMVLAHMVQVGPVSAAGLVERWPHWGPHRASHALRRLRAAGHVRRCGTVPRSATNTGGTMRQLYRASECGEAWLAAIGAAP